MCGISGIFNINKKSLETKSIIRKILNIQNKRGPDKQNIWFSECGKITFGHNRLSIIDLSEKATQPFVSLDKNFIITFNGEIYNYKELKKYLVKKKVKFKSNSDTEVILQAYKFWGSTFVTKLRGMFAFAIWDKVENKLLLARDPFGIKPMYFTKKENIFYFASQVKSILSIPSLSFKKSEKSMLDYFLWGNIQEPSTLYEDINSLEKGTVKIIYSNGTEENIQYANIKDTLINTKGSYFNNEKELDAKLTELITETVNYHQIADVPITYLLSAGVDSSVILASLDDGLKENNSALTLDFNYAGINDETILAKKTAKQNKIKHDVIKINQDEIEDLIKVYYKSMDLPTNDGLNNFLVSRIASKNNSKVIISGIGADEFFFGYPSFKQVPMLKKFSNFLPNTKIINKSFLKLFYNLFSKIKINTKYSGILSYGRNLNSAYMLQRCVFMPNEFEDLISKKIIHEKFDELQLNSEINNDLNGFDDENLSIMYLEIKYYLCSKLLRDSDWASMSNSIELRTPFVDWFFFKELVKIIKSNFNISKKNMINCFKEKIPKELYNRRKTGFNIPHKNYLNIVSNNKIEYTPLKDWSLLNYKKYLEYEK